MSEDESREALEAAIRQHVAVSADGAYLTDWILIAASATRDDADATTYVSETSDGPMHHKLGLVRYLSKRTEAMAFEDDDE
jgi:hypothetical protein